MTTRSTSTVTAGLRASLAAVILGLTLGAAQAQVVVICHPSVTLSADDVRDVFLGEKQLSGAIKLQPVDNAVELASFLTKFLSMEPAKYSSAWAKKAFRDGITAPPLKTSDADVVEFVKRTPGGVGYVKSAPTGVSVVTQK
jgi:hypothetical protein